MRVFLLAYILLCCTILRVHAQDTILRTNGDEVKAQVLAITPTRVTYLPTTEPPSSDTLHLLATEVFLIRYANGTKEVISNLAAVPVLGLGRTPGERYIQGREDARKYFKAPGAFWGTFGATVITAPISIYIPIVAVLSGSAAGVAIASSPPQDQNIIASDRTLLNDVNYLRGYKKEAKRKKAGNVVAGFGVGLVTGTVIWFAAALATTKHF